MLPLSRMSLCYVNCDKIHQPGKLCAKSTKLAMKGGQVHEPKFTTTGMPALAMLRREVEDLLERFTRVGLGAGEPT